MQAPRSKAMTAMSCRAWLSSQSWLCLSSPLVALGLRLQERERDDHQRELDGDEDVDGDDLGRGGGFPGDRVATRSGGRRREAGQRAG